MHSFIRFINNTDYPVISIYEDDTKLFQDIIRGTITPYINIRSGTSQIYIKQNTAKNILNINISIKDEEYATLIIENTNIHKINEPVVGSSPMQSNIRFANFSSNPNIFITENNQIIENIPPLTVTPYKGIKTKNHFFSSNYAKIPAIYLHPYKNYTMYIMDDYTIFVLDRHGQIKKK